MKTLNDELLMVCKTIDELCRVMQVTTDQLVFILNLPTVKTVIDNEVQFKKRSGMWKE